MGLLSSLRPYALATQALSFLLVLTGAFAMWKGLSVLSDSKSPIVVVLSGSMEPAFQRGDLLLLWNREGLLPKCWTCEFMPFLYSTPTKWPGYGMTEISAHGDTPAYWTESKEVKVGEVVVYEVQGKDIPIVHRVVRRFAPLRTDKALPSGFGNVTSLQILTKGDNNAADDVELYARGQSFLDRDRDVIGSVVGFVPYVGYGTILLSEYPWLKTVMLGLMGVSVVLQRE